MRTPKGNPECPGCGICLISKRNNPNLPRFAMNNINLAWPQAFIFDMDGTMVDNMDFHAKSWVNLFAETGHDVDENHLRNTMAGRTTVEVLRSVLGSALTAAEAERYSKRKEQIYQELYRPHLQPVVGLSEFLAACHSRGIKLAIGSSARKTNIDFILDGLDVRMHFDVIVGAENVKQGKPEPEMFLVAAARMGIAPSRCVVLEDAWAGVEAARRAGMPAWIIATSPEAESLASHPATVFVARDFNQLLQQLPS